MNKVSEISYHVPFSAKSSLVSGLHIFASLGAGAPHPFVLDTGSVGILAPRKVLGPAYQDFNPAQDIAVQFVSSGNTYFGQWVKVQVVLGVPVPWAGAGDYPTAYVEVFAVDRPTGFNGGILGVGFAIGDRADGGPARNPLLHLLYREKHLSHGYIVSTRGIDVGLTSANRRGFALIALQRNATDQDWLQPHGRLVLTGDFSPNSFVADLPFLMDTGIRKMILWLHAHHTPPNLPRAHTFPPGIAVNISAPPQNRLQEPALSYSFVTGDMSQFMAPATVEWRHGKGINTGRNVLAGADYLYDAAAGSIGFRPL